jgi:hypothetical protein
MTQEKILWSSSITAQTRTNPPYQVHQQQSGLAATEALLLPARQNELHATSHTNFRSAPNWAAASNNQNQHTLQLFPP